MSAPGQPSSSANATNTQSQCVVDPLDLLDFSEYDGLQSPTMSPVAGVKPQFAGPSSVASTTSTTMPASQTLSGPSHQYDQYKQQTPFVPGAVASTLAVNQSSGMSGYTLDYMASNMSNNDELFDFNSVSQNSMTSPDMDVDFDSPPEASFFFPPPTINPNAIGGREAETLPSPPSMSSNVGRMYPGMHQQAALAKARAQQRQQQQIIQQQQQQQRQQQQPKPQRPKSAQPSDPLVEQKITQLLNSMRAKPVPLEPQGNSPLMNMPKSKKDEEEMDEDERLLASEEGKKLSSKERRQLRNKVSARAFRSRRKEYISQLESEIANKVTENGDLRAQNRALIEENRRLSDLTRMLLSSPSFSNFLDHLSSNPNALPQQQQQQQPAPQVEQRQPESRQLPKDVDPYTAVAQQSQQQQIGMVMVPEQTMDFSMLNLDSNATFNYQPQVFTVLETPEMPEIDTAILAGKPSDVPESMDSHVDKVEIPIAESPALVESAKAQAPESVMPAPSDKVIADLDSDIYDDAPASASTRDTAIEQIVAGLVSINLSEKPSSSIELVVRSAEPTSSMALRRVQRLCASLEAPMLRLKRLTGDL